MRSSPASPATWTERYEALRQHFLDGPQVLGTTALGLLLLFRHGAAGWMQSWDEQAGPRTARPLSPPATRWARTPDGQYQLTVLLAQMTTAHLPGRAPR